MVDTREDFVIFRSNEYTAPLWGTRDDDEIVLGQMFTIFADLLSEISIANRFVFFHTNDKSHKRMFSLMFLIFEQQLF